MRIDPITEFATGARIMRRTFAASPSRRVCIGVGCSILASLPPAMTGRADWVPSEKPPEACGASAASRPVARDAPRQPGPFQYLKTGAPCLCADALGPPPQNRPTAMVAGLCDEAKQTTNVSPCCLRPAAPPLATLTRFFQGLIVLTYE